MNKGMVCFGDNWKGNRKEWVECPQLLHSFLLHVLLPRLSRVFEASSAQVFLRLGCRDGSLACREAMLSS